MDEKTTTAVRSEENHGTVMPTGRVTTAPVRRFLDDIDDVLEDWTTGRGWLAPVFRRESLARRFDELFRGAFSPDLEVAERDGQLIVRADLPGMTKEDVSVEITDSMLVIRGERKRTEETRREGDYRSERSYGRFERLILLPSSVDSSGATACFADGVLEVAMAATKRGDEANGRRVAID